MKISVATSCWDLLGKVNRTLCWGCPNSSSGAPQQEMTLLKNGADTLTWHHHNYILISNYAMFHMIDCSHKKLGPHVTYPHHQTNMHRVEKTNNNSYICKIAKMVINMGCCRLPHQSIFTQSSMVMLTHYSP